MNTTEIPFNKFVGIVKSSAQGQVLLELPASENLQNHLGTVHASAQFALAEACSGEYLLQIFAKLANGIIPVVRKTETKFKKPADGKLFAKASIAASRPDEIIDKLEKKGRVIIPVNVTVSNENEETTMTAKIDWFIQKISENES